MLRDDFTARADGPPTVALTGQTWIRASAAPGFAPVQAMVVGGALTAPDSGDAVTAAYTSATLTANPTRMTAQVVFDPGLSLYGNVGLIANPHGPLASGGNTDITRDAFHIIFNDFYVSIGIFQASAFLPPTVVYYGTPCLRDGATAYTLGWRFNATTNTITVEMPDGTTVSRTDARLGQVIGPYVTFEHYWVGATAARPRFLSVSAETPLPAAPLPGPLTALTSPARLRAAVMPSSLSLAAYSDGQLRRVIREATAAVQAYVGWPVLARAYRERRYGNATYTMRVANYPIISLDSISYQQPSGAGLVSVDALGNDISLDRSQGLIVNATRWGSLDDGDPLYPAALFRQGSVYDISYVGGYALAEVTQSVTSAGDSTVTVNTTTGFVVGEWYLLDDDEMVQVAVVGAGSLTFASPLARAHPLGALIVSNEPEFFAAIATAERLCQDYLLGMDSQGRQGVSSVRQGSISISYRDDPFSLTSRQTADLRGLMRRGMVFA